MPNNSNSDAQLAYASWLERDFQYSKDSNIWSPKGAAVEFGYSDGDSNENYLLSFLKGVESCEVMSDALREGMKDWPSTYHLHHQRSNVFRPIVNQLRGPILEIGAGCGVLTRFLGEQGHDILALEGSPRRASIIGERCRDLSNVSVVCTNFQDFRNEQKFQTITLIGVLEYARIYFSEGGDGDPIDHMLGRAVEMLEPGGRLILAIENQLGIKYFAGYPEDHIGTAMAGIEDQYTEKSVVTFGRKELVEKLEKAGLKFQNLLLPFPDYKFPQLVLSEDWLQGPHAGKLGPLIGAAALSDRQKNDSPNFRMSKAIKPILRNGLGADLASSFLFVTSKAEFSATSTCVFYGNCDRRKPYLKSVEFVEENDGLVVRRRKLSSAEAPKDASVAQVLEEERYIDGTIWTEALEDILLRRGWSIDEIAEWAKVWLSALQLHTGTEAPMHANSEIEGRFLDAIPRNFIVDAFGVGHFIDLEWHDKGTLTLGYVLFRGLFDSFLNIELVAKSKHSSDVITLIIEVCELLNILIDREDVRDFLERENNLTQQVSGGAIIKNKLWFLRTRLTHKTIAKVDRFVRNWRRIGYKLRHPFLSFRN